MTVPNAVRRTLVVVVQGGQNRVDEVGIELPISWPQSGQGNDRLGRVTDMVGDVPHEPSVLGIRVPVVVELDVVGARSVRVRDLRLWSIISVADDSGVHVRTVRQKRHSTFGLWADYSLFESMVPKERWEVSALFQTGLARPYLGPLVP